MQPSPTLNYLGLPFLEILSIDQSREVIIFNVKALFERDNLRCPHCCKVQEGAVERSGTVPSKIYSKGPYTRKVDHLEVCGKPSRLHIFTTRFQCCKCKGTFIPEIPGVRPYRQSSEPFRTHIYKQHHAGITGKDVAQNHRIGSATVERIYQDHTLLKAKKRLSNTCPQVLGIDEHSIHCKQKNKRGTYFATTLCDLKNHKVFDIVEGRIPRELRGYFSKIQGRHLVKVVCIDLSSSYRSLIKEFFPNAKIVADRFHVIRVMQHHFMELFKSLAPEIKSHRGYLAALRTKPENLSDKRKALLESLFEKHPALKVIYDQLQDTHQLLSHKTLNAKAFKPLSEKLLYLINELKHSKLKPMITLAKTLNQWIEPIVAMWRFSKNNGITEGFHRKMKLIQRRAYGFKNFQNYRLRVIAQCG